jgi:hypothetical protein
MMSMWRAQEYLPGMIVRTFLKCGRQELTRFAWRVSSMREVISVALVSSTLRWQEGERSTDTDTKFVDCVPEATLS